MVTPVNKYQKIKKSDDEGFEWITVTRNGVEIFHCQTAEDADKWITTDKESRK